MTICNFVHKGLREFYLEGGTRGLPAGAASKLQMMFAFLESIESTDELRNLRGWKAHPLIGDRKGVWSLNVTRNWRLTFGVNPEAGEICDLNLEDYH